jgi:hypothetical protein
LVFDYTRCKFGGKAPDSVDSWFWDGTNNKCTVRFTLKKTYKAPVFLYYRLSNFYQNHRRYVKSLSTDQLSGVAAPVSALGDCNPLATDSKGRIYYPCGLIANSMFFGMMNLGRFFVDKVY